jgi:hypothetical protein
MKPQANYYKWMPSSTVPAKQIQQQHRQRQLIGNSAVQLLSKQTVVALIEHDRADQRRWLLD